MGNGSWRIERGDRPWPQPRLGGALAEDGAVSTTARSYASQSFQKESTDMEEEYWKCSACTSLFKWQMIAVESVRERVKVVGSSSFEDL